MKGSRSCMQRAISAATSNNGSKISIKRPTAVRAWGISGKSDCPFNNEADFTSARHAQIQSGETRDCQDL